MSHTLTFGTYTFPQAGLSYNTDFKNVTPTTVRFAGMRGGWGEDGQEAAPTGIGKITVSFDLTWLEALTRHGYTSVTRANIEDAMRKERDAIGKLASLGRQKLTSTVGTQGARFCWATVNYINETAKPETGDLFADVQVVFQVSNPAWLGGSYGGLTYGPEAGEYGGGLYYGSGGLSNAVSGLKTSLTVTNNGNATAYVIARLEAGAGGLNSPEIRRIQSGYVADRVKYLANMTSGQQFIADGQAYRATLDGVAVWANVDYEHPNFLRLLPGANTIEVKTNDPANGGTLVLYFNDTWI